jgi:hypothetical protein
LKKNINNKNKVLIGDILASLTFYASKNIIDLGGIILSDSTITTLNLSNSLIDNFLLKDSIIDELDISNCCCSKISIKNCIIKKVYGLGSLEEIPPFLNSNDIESFEKESLSSFNNKINLHPSQMIFISIIKKLFYLDIKGKREVELLKGFGNKTDKQLSIEILKILSREKIISRIQEKKDIRYIARAFNRPRMNKILAELNHSKDKLWLEISRINVLNSK